MNRILLIAISVSAFGIAGRSQTALSGHIYEKTTDSTLHGINILNKSNNLSARSSKDGHYSIAANEGDKVVFSATGFRADTVTVTFDMLLTQHDITLSAWIISLKGVTVTGSYQADSAARRAEYRRVFEEMKNITGGYHPNNGVGISISPLSHFSKKAKQQRALRDRLVKEEREAYIDHAFPQEWVERLTGLRGDALSLFMYRYRPSYMFCRDTDRDGMLIYINDRLKEFRNTEDKTATVNKNSR